MTHNVMEQIVCGMRMDNHGMALLSVQEIHVFVVQITCCNIHAGGFINLSGDILFAFDLVLFEKKK